MASRPFLPLLTTMALIVFVAAAAPAPAPAPEDNILRPVAPACSTMDNYTAGSQYQKNLADLLARMPAAAMNNSWFYTGSAGAGPADQVHGLLTCYADANATQCADCLARAPAGIASAVCPGSRRVNAAYDACVLRYADAPVSPDSGVAFYVYELTGNEVDDPFALDAARALLMGALAREAAASPARVANGSAPCAGATEDVYGLAQCTRDLTPGQCSTCLAGYVAALGEVFGDYTGGAIKGYSCYVRYRIGAFDVTLPPSPSTSPPPSPPPAPATQPPSPPPAPVTQPPSSPPAPVTQPPSSPPAPVTQPPSSPPAPATQPPSSLPAPATQPPSSPPAPATQPPSPPPAPATQPPSSPPVPATQPPSSPPAPATQPPSPPPAPATQPPSPPPAPVTQPPSSPPAPATQPPSPPPAPATEPPSSPPAPATQPPSPPPCP